MKLTNLHRKGQMPIWEILLILFGIVVVGLLVKSMITGNLGGIWRLLFGG